MQKHTLSKSTFLKGLQCNKALYLNTNHRELRDELSKAQMTIFSQGTSVGELACGLFPGGVDCSPENYYDVQQSVLKTRQEIEKGTKIIYEAAFQYNGVYSALDILVKHPDGWRAYEVKSSTKVSEIYEMDATIQYYCITNSGIDLKDISIVHINNQYVKKGAIDVHELFAMESVIEQVLCNSKKIPEQIANLKEVLNKKEVPKVDIGPHCSTPYTCDFSGHCWKHVPEYSVFNIAWLGGDKKFDLYKNYGVNFKDIPADYDLNQNQWMQVRNELNKEKHIDTKAIKKFVDELEYPIYHLDFETFGTAVPIFDGSRPYQQLVFQYSLHIEHPNGHIEHREYLAETNGEDPRDNFIEQLIKDCGTSGDVMVYNVSFERGKLKDLIEYYPEAKKPISKIIDRLKDLMIPFRNRSYYTPEMQGSFSIKKVLPALVPELNYNALSIQEGQAASSAFAEMLQGTFLGDMNQKRKDLLEYCKMDTWAMVKILEVLKQV